jgi:hypothetical protein
MKRLYTIATLSLLLLATSCDKEKAHNHRGE